MTSLLCGILTNLVISSSQRSYNIKNISSTTWVTIMVLLGDSRMSKTSTDCHETHFHLCLITSQGFWRGSKWRTSSPRYSSNIFELQPRHEIFHARACGRFIDTKSNLRRKELHRINQSSNFLVGIFNSRCNVRAPIQTRRERQSQHVQRSFFFKNKPIQFHNKSSRVFPTLKPTSNFLPPQCLVGQILSSETNNSSCHKSDVSSYFK